ncbi:M56 family metallopeptidase [Aquisphaera insulae]|uniref:M56 family metallopeptidase n=1 Tax=Aquisphaera insulae TaxID=2712864 RepID=UPI0013ECE5FA|nr:M56 family metallopeptidase [Aquisphaera insulae]
MDGLLIGALTNSAWAAAMAIGVMIAVRLIRPRPAVVHLCWVLVLLKLVTPAVIHHRVTPTVANADPALPLAKGELEGVNDTSVGDRKHPPVSPLGKQGRDSSALPLTKGELEGVNDTSVGDRKHPPVSPLGKGGSEFRPVPKASFAWPWRTILATVWLAGLGAWTVAVCLQTTRVRRLLRTASPAPEVLKHQVDRLAARMGLPTAPSAHLISAPIPPMLWALVGPPRLLLPEGLWGRLDEAQRDTIVVHELAHLKRRDHWVRRLEAVALGLYWWNPVAWWARRRVEDAEEQSCDALVASTLPEAVESYAEALVATAVFLSGIRAPRPFGASGVGRVPPLRRRLNMILRDASPATSRPVPAAAMLLAGLSLLALPGWATGQDPAAPAAKPSEAPKPRPPAAEPLRPAEAKPTQPEKPARIKVSQPIVREVRDRMYVRGVVEAAQSVDLRPRVGGTLTEVRVKPGQTVEKGDVLFVIDPRTYQLKLDRADADVARAEVQLRHQSTTLKYTEKLVANRTISSQEADLARDGRDEAMASLRAATASRDLARLDLEATKVTAPFRGRVGRPILAVGSVVSAESTSLATITAPDPALVSFNLGQNVFGMTGLETGAPISFEIQDGRQTRRLRGKLDSMDAQFDPSTGNLRCRATVPNPDGTLLPGQSATVVLSIGEPRQAMLANFGSAARLITGGRTGGVLVVDEAGKIESRDAQLGSFREGGLVEIVSGLKEDDWVVPVDWMNPDPDNRRLPHTRPGMTIEVERVKAPEPEPIEP